MEVDGIDDPDNSGMPVQIRDQIGGSGIYHPIIILYAFNLHRYLILRVFCRALQSYSPIFWN